MNKIAIVFGTRPEIIRLSQIIKKVNKYFNSLLIYTNQNYTKSLKDVFFDNFNINNVDYFLDMKGSYSEQISSLFTNIEKIFYNENPKKLLILGDTNSGLSSVIAKKMKIKVYHLEAGNRCYDDNVPEEVNRRIIDHTSDVLLPYTERSRCNLLSEGIPNDKIYVVGNPIYEVIKENYNKIMSSKIKEKLKLCENEFFLVTLHRYENIIDEKKMLNFLKILNNISKIYKKKVIVSTHPHTASKLKKIKNIILNKNINFLEPFSFFDFVNLELNSFCVLTDSGTVQEECCIFKKPVIIMRNNNERKETIEHGSGILSGINNENIIRSINISIDNKNIDIPLEYKNECVSSSVIKILSEL